MLNFRKLRQDFSSPILKEGKELFDKGSVQSVKILHMDGKSIRLAARVRGAYDNIYESEIEIDRNESHAVDSNCDCTYTYDCQHIAAFLYFLEQHLDEIIVTYSNEADLENKKDIDEEVKKQLRETFDVAATKEDLRKGQQYQKEVLNEYVRAAQVLGSSPFFLPPEFHEEDKAELAILFTSQGGEVFNLNTSPEVQIAVRLPCRSKPFMIPNVKAFFDAVFYREPIRLAGRKYFITPHSFDLVHKEMLELFHPVLRYYPAGEERQLRSAQIDKEALGTILARAYELALLQGKTGSHQDKETVPLPCLYMGNLEEPLCYSKQQVAINLSCDYLESPAPTLLLKPYITIEEENIAPEETLLFESARPGLIYRNTYYKFPAQIKRAHLKEISKFQEITIPEPLFGTLIENGMTVLRQYAHLANLSTLNRFVTLPYTREIKGRCEMHYLNGELEGRLFFIYDGIEIPAALSKLTFEDVSRFISKEGIVARNLVEERKIVEELFQDFLYDEKDGVFRVKSEKKIVEFMTEVIPKYQNRIQFQCPENLSEQFIYDDSSFELHLRESHRIDLYDVELKVKGHLKGISLDLLWDCIAAKKGFLELKPSQVSKAKKSASSKIPRILVLDLGKITPLVQLFDEIGLSKIENYVEPRPLWSLTSIYPAQFEALQIKYSITEPLKEIQRQIRGESHFQPKEIPTQIQATLRKYQKEGVHWLERLRGMHLNGILADDMGLGKTLQAIIAITQSKAEKVSMPSLIVCPTSLVYNWKEEFHKFNPELKPLVIDNMPSIRRKLLKTVDQYDVIITSYNLMQKDIELYKEIKLDYLILDEAQHIKNRGTRNARSVKMIQANHRLILTGTPIENSLEELWSLFDFLMPGLLSSYDRFVEKYIRSTTLGNSKTESLEGLKKKVSPFILRRMKEDVLEDLPPVSEILYHCHLSDAQKELYHSYAASAKEELSRLVKKEGFDKIQIHVLATLTRLKQICCHPAIFAKETAEVGDSAKYDLLMELIDQLLEGKHKTVIFSQYTKMLGILKGDLKERGIPFAYLDGSSKNRLDIVKEFNENQEIPLFLVSLKAGGSGLNLVGADTVIHYDMWWNPAVENQATDRVHRIGQKKSVSSYKLITMNTIEEKILNLQNRKKGLVKKVINSDDEVISKLTWEEVLELLQI